MFKVGDRVKRIKGNFVGMKVGDIGTIERMTEGDWGFNIFLKEFPGLGHDSRNFILVKEDKKGEIMVKITKFTDELIGKNIMCNIGAAVIANAKIQKESGTFFICQNEVFGSTCREKFGYVYSWNVEDGSLASLTGNNVTNVFLKEVTKTQRVEIEYCDTKMIAEASFIDSMVSELDNSWKRKIEAERKNTAHLPFDKEAYTMSVHLWERQNPTIHIPALKANMVVDRFVYARERFKINNPFVSEEIQFFGVFDIKTGFIGISSEPKFGAHYMVGGGKDGYICLGDLVYKKPITFRELVSLCGVVAELVKTINYNSLAAIFLPRDEKNGEFLDRLSGKTINRGIVEDFINKGVLTKIDPLGGEKCQKT